MSIQIIVVIAAAVGLTFKLLQVVFLVKKAGGELYGRPVLPGYWVLFAKFAIILPFVSALSHTVGNIPQNTDLPRILVHFGTVVMVAATIFLVLSLDHLGRFTKMGLPVKDTIRLQTAGIYRFSRNPMYLGLILLAIASVLMVPDILSIISGITGIILHHLIILREEHFLKRRFGQEYIDYQSKTRRYL